MTITGAHVILYSPEADALRNVLSDTFAWHHVLLYQPRHPTAI